jgi:hypothetical protein
MGVKKTAMTLAVTAFVTGWSGTAMAQCATVDPMAVPDMRIDPLDTAGAAQLMQPATLNFRRVGVDATPLTIVYQILDEDTAVHARVGASAGPQVEWRSDDTGRDISVSRGDAYALLRSGKVVLAADENSKRAGLRLFLKELREDLPAGIYREQFTVRYWCDEEGATMPYESPGIVAVTVQVPNVLSASVAGASARGEIDFLDFATLSRSLSVSVRSTGRYSVSARSLNGSVMLREGAAAPTEAERITYSVRFGGHRLELDTSGGFVHPRAGLAGQQIPLEVTAEDVSKKRAGSYNDTLILTLSPVS